MPTLLVAEHNNNSLSDQTAKSLTAARQLGDAVDILVAGFNATAAAEAAARLEGVRLVLIADAEHYAHQVAEPMSALLFSLTDGYDAIVAPGTSAGKNMLPRLAALLDVMQVSDVMEVVDATTFKRPIYAGNAVQTVRSTDVKRVLTIRTASFAATGQSSTSAPIEPVVAAADPGLSEFGGETSAASERPDLTSARVVVSGGRAFRSSEQFNALLGPLADSLGAAIGASRAAVDAGYAPNDWQVGQTGKTVAPELYIACGISGAIQHVAGMKDTRIIVAINSDADAPIFGLADFGLVGDLFEILPALTAELQRLRIAA